MRANVKNAQPFIHVPDWSPGMLTDSENLRARFAPPAQQLQLI
jgi:predicted DNA-binding helix-hairpin-helix protein